MRPIATADGVPLQGHLWPASARPARGTVLVVHGLGEHGGRYAALAAHLAALGWTVVAFDHRGHGASGGPRGAIPADDSLLADLGRVVEAVQAEHPGPLVLLGHSLGGLLAGRFVAEGLAAATAHWWRPVDALVMSSPALDPGMHLGQKALLALLRRLAPDLALGNGLQAEWLSHDAEVVAAYRADPLVHDRITPRLVRFIVDGGAQVRALAPRWALPTLLMYAGADRCVAPRGSAAFAAAAPPGVVEARCFGAMRHEIFNEPDRAEVLSTLTRWLAARGH
ncbi:alpha/beta fold hydrolase [Ideonella sp. A 288]|uniref:alpha/beta fold hydrolase n=1 Tax=Ideonella sp. A 288 TaxID=1962181 RepID=UPI000B4BDE67|nr:alpha/beta fold hydrolase [Ideonella sp. A 288]